jgi:chromosomal replication initiator protein
LPTTDGKLAACPTDWEGNLLIVEDLQHLPPVAAATLVQVFDRCQAHEQQMVFTASVGPRQLGHLPARLTSRLACGLVVGLEPFGPSSRLAFLRDRAERRQLPVGADVLTWLAEHVGGSGRQLEGAIARLEELVRLHARLPDLETVVRHFQGDADASRPTVERIAERVSRYFRIDPRHLQSRQRSRSALVPRQVSMYLARRLTGMSLEQIGAYFGGHDHSTVLHACRKIDQALSHDANLSGAVRQLQADLG